MSNLPPGVRQSDIDRALEDDSERCHECNGAGWAVGDEAWHKVMCPVCCGSGVEPDEDEQEWAEDASSSVHRDGHRAVPRPGTAGRFRI